MVYYNEFDQKAAAWLRQLIKSGLIANGEVDERSIVDVRGSDLAGFAQCHFFAGIAGWSYALRIAGWPDEKPVWTGSCPCQPFSNSGEKNRQSDERHLCPDFARLIGECKPAIVFGEQVETAIPAGWLDDAFDDLEAKAYACASTVLTARGAGARHERKRIYWVAKSLCEGPQGSNETGKGLRITAGASPAECGDRGVYARILHEPDALSVRKTDGLSRGVGFVHGFGNAIVPQVAAEFIRACVGFSSDGTSTPPPG